MDASCCKGLLDQRLVAEMTTFTGETSRGMSMGEDNAVIQWVLKMLCENGSVGTAYRVFTSLVKLYPTFPCVELWPFVRETEGGVLKMLVARRDPEDLLYAHQWAGIGSAPMLINFFGIEQPKEVMEMYPAVLKRALENPVVFNTPSVEGRMMLRILKRDLGIQPEDAAPWIKRARPAGMISQMTPRGGEGALLYYLMLSPPEALKIPTTETKKWLPVDFLLQSEEFIEHQKPRLRQILDHIM